MSLTSIVLDKFKQKLRTNVFTNAHVPYAIANTKRTLSARVMSSTFRLASSQNIAYIINSSGSSVLMDVRTALLRMESNVALSGQVRSIATYKVTSSLPTGGTQATKVQSTTSATGNIFDSADDSDSHCNLFGHASADDTASAITWTLAGSPMWRIFTASLNSVVEQFRPPDSSDHAEGPTSLIPLSSVTTLRAGEALMFRGVAAFGPGERLAVVVTWDEYTLT